MSGVLITQGTATNIQTDLVGTTNYQIVKLDRGIAGASSLFTGTIDAVTNLAAGTVTALSSDPSTIQFLYVKNCASFVHFFKFEFFDQFFH